jgi:hypothetical protein
VSVDTFFEGIQDHDELLFPVSVIPPQNKTGDDLNFVHLSLTGNN